MGCELWEDDDMLLEEDQRHGGPNAREPIAQAPVAQEAITTVPEYRTGVGDFDWIYDCEY